MKRQVVFSRNAGHAAAYWPEIAAASHQRANFVPALHGRPLLRLSPSQMPSTAHHSTRRPLAKVQSHPVLSKRFTPSVLHSDPNVSSSLLKLASSRCLPCGRSSVLRPGRRQGGSETSQQLLRHVAPIVLKRSKQRRLLRIVAFN